MNTNQNGLELTKVDKIKEEQKIKEEFLKLVEQTPFRINASEFGRKNRNKRLDIKCALTGQPGIYAIINITNNKYYIGSSVDLCYRFRSHRCSLNNNKHNNRYLQFSWNKYKQNNFDFVVLELVDNEENLKGVDLYRKLRKIEQQYLDKFSPYGNIGYNLSKEASYSTGRVFTYEDLKNGRASISVEQFERIIELLQDPYNSFVWIAKEVNTHEDTVREICKKHKFVALTKDIEFPPRQHHSLKKDSLERVVELVNQGATLREISQDIGTKPCYVSTILRENNIKRNIDLKHPKYQYDLYGNLVKNTTVWLRQ